MLQEMSQIKSRNLLVRPLQAREANFVECKLLLRDIPSVSWRVNGGRFALYIGLFSSLCFGGDKRDLKGHFYS